MPDVRAVHAQTTSDALVVEFEDGRILRVLLEWFPRLRAATRAERKELRLVGRGVGIHWPRIDEDVHAASLLVARALTASSDGDACDHEAL